MYCRAWKCYQWFCFLADIALHRAALETEPIVSFFDGFGPLLRMQAGDFRGAICVV